MRTTEVSWLPDGSLYRWSRLRIVSNSQAAKATIVIPLVGYMILFNQKVIEYAALSPVLGGHQVDIPIRLIMIYMGLCTIAVSATLYGYFCPSEVKRFDSAEAYVGHAVVNVPMLVRNQYERDLIGSEFKEDLEFIRSKGYVPEEFWKAFLHLYYQHLDETYQIPRFVAFAGYVIGFATLAVPSVEVFFRVNYYFFSKTFERMF